MAAAPVHWLLAAALAQPPDAPKADETEGATVPAPSQAAVDEAGTTNAEGLYRRGQAAYLASDYDGCIAALHSALEHGFGEREPSVRAAEVQLSLAMCRFEAGRVAADTAELGRAVSMLQRIVGPDRDDYRPEELDLARAKLELARQSLDQASASKCPAPSVTAIDPRPTPVSPQQRQRRAAGITLVSVGAASILLAGGLIAYGATVVPQARRLGVLDQRPWQSYGAMGIGFGVTSALVGVAALAVGGRLLGQLGRRGQRSVALRVR